MDVLSDAALDPPQRLDAVVLVDAVAPWSKLGAAFRMFPACRAAGFAAPGVITSSSGTMLGGAARRAARHASPRATFSSCRMAPPTFSPARPMPRSPTEPTGTVGFFRPRMAAGELPTVVAQCGSGSGRRSSSAVSWAARCAPSARCSPALPPMIHLRATTAEPADAPSGSISRCASCASLRRAGVACCCLAELMFIEVVRACVGDVDDSRAGWLARLRDPLIARALHLLHQAPARAGRWNRWPSRRAPRARWPSISRGGSWASRRCITSWSGVCNWRAGCWPSPGRRSSPSRPP